MPITQLILSLKTQNVDEIKTDIKEKLLDYLTLVNDFEKVIKFDIEKMIFFRAMGYLQSH